MSAQPAVVVVIPTFKPSAHLLDLVSVLQASVEYLVVSDDASPCTSDALLRTVAAIAGVTVLRHTSNAGIARGLNEGLRAATECDAEWLLTMDQDSMVDMSYINDLVKAATSRLDQAERTGAVGAEVIDDLSGPMTYPASTVRGLLVTEEVIQTGTLWNVDALNRVGGFDQSLGMDAVDAAACLALRRVGFVVGLADGLTVKHAIGRSTSVSIGGRTVMVTGHSPERRASMLRSRLRLFPAEFAESPRHAVRTVRRVVINQTLGLLIEGQRWEKAKGTARGLRPSRGR